MAPFLDVSWLHPISLNSRTNLQLSQHFPPPFSTEGFPLHSGLLLRKTGLPSPRPPLSLHCLECPATRCDLRGTRAGHRRVVRYLQLSGEFGSSSLGSRRKKAMSEDKSCTYYCF
uniref:Uncharacterized protein n=1 Tax=Micrurus corallinus TaxID=54390 RepID=A0A2D4EZN6_MICCO